MDFYCINYSIERSLQGRFLCSIFSTNILNKLIHNLPKARNNIVNMKVITDHKIKSRHGNLTSLHKVPKY
jgi:hypothetical protein